MWNLSQNPPFVIPCMRILLTALFMFPGTVLSWSEGAADRESRHHSLMSPRRHLTRRPTGFSTGEREIPRGSSLSPPSYHEVSDGVVNIRCLLGGGRKLVRHECSGEEPLPLEAVFTRDEAAGYNAPVIHDGLSLDNGVTWSVTSVEVYPDLHDDSDHVISFCNGLTFIGFRRAYQEQGYLHFTSDLFTCLQAFNPPVPVINDRYYLQQVVTPVDDSCSVSWSMIEFGTGDPYTTWFMRSTDGGASWSEPLNVTETVAADGFDMAGMDGPLIMDADGDFIAALAMVNLDDDWETSHGFPGPTLLGEDKIYPAFTRSTDGGDTWSDLRLVFGNDGSAYPRGHTQDQEFNETVHYVGGVAGAAYTAFNNCQDNVSVTSDGRVHLAVTMDDTTYGYTGVWHVLVEDGTFEHGYAGFPEDPDLTGKSGVAFMPSVAGSEEGFVVVGWTEFVQPDGLGDICCNVVPAGETHGLGPVNVTGTPAEDETYQRLVDRSVPAGNPGEYYIDWLFFYYGEGGTAADSTLWHLQAVHEAVRIDGPENGGRPVPRTVSLHQNFPNPFNPRTTLSFDVPNTGGRARHVLLTVYDLRGRKVKTLVDRPLTPGSHRVVWDGRDGTGGRVSSGVSFAVLRIGEETATMKMVMLE